MFARARAGAENNYTTAYEGGAGDPTALVNSSIAPRKRIGFGISRVRIRYGYRFDRAQSDPLRLVFISLCEASLRYSLALGLARLRDP